MIAHLRRPRSCVPSTPFPRRPTTSPAPTSPARSTYPPAARSSATRAAYRRYHIPAHHSTVYTLSPTTSLPKQPPISPNPAFVRSSIRRARNDHPPHQPFFAPLIDATTPRSITRTPNSLPSTQSHKLHVQKPASHLPLLQVKPSPGLDLISGPSKTNIALHVRTTFTYTSRLPTLHSPHLTGFLERKENLRPAEPFSGSGPLFQWFVQDIFVRAGLHRRRVGCVSWSNIQYVERKRLS